MVNGRDAPCDADPQEDVHRVASGHVSHACVGVLVLAGGHLARERVCNKVTCLDFPPSCLGFLRQSPPSPAAGTSVSANRCRPCESRDTARNRFPLRAIGSMRETWGVWRRGSGRKRPKPPAHRDLRQMPRNSSDQASIAASSLRLRVCRVHLRYKPGPKRNDEYTRNTNIT